MKPCLSQTSTMPSSFADDLAQSANGGATTIEVWLTKLETHLKTHSPDDTRTLIADRGIALAAAAMQGGLLLSQGERRAAHWDHFKRRLDLCERFQIPILVVAADPVSGPIEATNLATAIESLAEAARWAAGFGIRIAFEFYGVGSVCTSLETAVRMSMKSAKRTSAFVSMRSTSSKGRVRNAICNWFRYKTSPTFKCAMWPAYRANS